MSFEKQPAVDTSWIKAIAHPLRWRILDELRSSDDPLTATQLSERVGESPANCSFHLRTLARYDLIEEAGGGKGRSRPWRPRAVTIEISDSSTAEGARELRDIIRDRAFQAIQAWEHGEVNPGPSSWRDAATSAEWELRLTVEDLRQIGEEFKAVLDRYNTRTAVPDGAVRSKVLAWAFPIGELGQTGSEPAQTPVDSSLHTGPGRRSPTPDDGKSHR